MKIEDFIDQWIAGQCRKFKAEIEEYEQEQTDEE